MTRNLAVVLQKLHQSGKTVIIRAEHKQANALFVEEDSG